MESTMYLIHCAISYLLLINNIILMSYDFEEYYQRLRIFTENKRMIDKHNEGNHSFTMGLNGFSDMTFNEFRKYFLLSEPQNCSATKGSYLSSNGPHPDSIDWRKKGNYITPVKNQVKGHSGGKSPPRPSCTGSSKTPAGGGGVFL
uniref:Cathepsin propeptide inhibitor domain-containing protein n=1 Tax=Poecilia latipinna TaxID=48699 RepID=A0A3B3UV26_9TELE